MRTRVSQADRELAERRAKRMKDVSQDASEFYLSAGKPPETDRADAAEHAKCRPMRLITRSADKPSVTERASLAESRADAAADDDAPDVRTCSPHRLPAAHTHAPSAAALGYSAHPREPRRQTERCAESTRAYAISLSSLSTLWEIP